MQSDLWKYAAILSLSALAGHAIEAALLVCLIVAICLIIWQLHRVNLIQKWLDNPSNNPMPEMGGLFYQLHKKLNKRNANYANRKKQLSNYLSQFRKAVGAMPDAIILIDESEKIEWANDNAASLLGIRWPEDAGVRFGDLIRHPDVEAMLKSTTPHNTLPTNILPTNTLPTNAQRKSAQSTNASNNKDAKDSIEINSLHHNDQIINLKSVPYTTATRMIIARDVSRLIKVNQMHTDFVANVSHELKTPLTVLKGYVEILQNSPEVPTKFAKPLEQMSVQSARMQLIVSDLLYLAKLEDNANKAPHQPVEVSYLVNAILEALQPLLEEKKHQIQLDISPNMRIFGSGAELHSAFSNLIANAINYTQANGTIRIVWQKSTDDTGAVFSVKDNGLGIPSHHISRLTQRFYRVDTDRSREGGGTGLGLAIVKHVLQRHDGTLDIQSQDGVGSTFFCYFPNNQIQILEHSNMSALLD